MSDLWSVTRLLEDTNAVNTKALREEDDNSVVVLLELLGSVGMMFGVGLIVRVDHVTRTAILGGEDISALSLAVENPFGFDEVRLEGMDVV